MVENYRLNRLIQEKENHCATEEKGEYDSALCYSALKHLCTLIDSVPCGIQEIDSDGTITFCNTAYQQMLGYQKEELIGKPFWELVLDGVERERLHAYFKRLITEQPPLDSYTSVDLTKDGRAIEIQVNWNYYRDNKGKLLGLISVVTDVTERRQAERMLRQSENRAKETERWLIDAIENISEGFALWSAKDRLVLCNSKYREFYSLLLAQLNPGIHFEELLRLGIQQGQFLQASTDPKIWLRQRLSWHAHPSEPYEESLNHDRWLMVSEHRTSDGGIVAIHTDITELKAREQALDESQQTLRAVLNATTDTILLLELDGRCVLINPTGAIRFGYQIDNVIGRCIYDMMPHSSAARRRELVAEVIATKTPRLMEDEHNGHWFEANICPVFNEQGEVKRIAVFSRNITLRKQAEQELRESERLYRQLFVSSRAVCLLVDPMTAQIVDANQSALDYYGYSLTQFKNMTTFEINTLAPHEIRQEIQKAVEEKRNHFFFRHRLASGEIRDVEVYSGPIVISRRKLLFSIIHDITERVRAERSLKESEKKYRTIINTTAQGYWLIDSKTLRIREVNQSLCAMLGYQESEILGKTPFDFMDNENGKILENQRIKINNIEHHRYEIVLKKKSGENIFTHFSSTTTYDENNHSATFAFITDITKRKRAEEALKQSLTEQEIIFNNSMVGIAFLGEDGKLLRFNRKLLEMFGHSEEELQGHTLKNLYLHYEDYKAIALEALPLLRRGETYQTESLLCRKDKTLFWGRLWGKIIDATQPSQGYIWNIEDITNQRKAQDELRLAATVFESTSEAIVVTDINHKIIAVNPAFIHITGYTKEEVLNKNSDILLSILRSGPHDATFFQVMWETLLKTGKWQGEIWNRRKNDKLYPAWLSITAVLGVDNKIKQYVAIFNDITQRKQAEAIVHHQANFDALTDLPNRMLFMQRLATEIHHAIRDGSRVALMFIDLDRFKWVNDTLGHIAGDRLLQETAWRLKSCVRSVDTVARLAGDEFTIVLPHINDRSDVEIVAKRLLESLANPFKLENREVHISCSIGVAFFPRDGQSLDSLIKNADTAMYQAKLSGRNTFRFFTPEMSAQVSEHQRLEKALRHAVEHKDKEFTFYYQPVVEAMSERIIGAEALLRWRNPGGEIHLPDWFIPLAENKGLIGQIGEWGLITAVNQLREWHDNGFKHLHIAVNLSAQQFYSKKDIDAVINLLKYMRLPNDALVLEITETMVVEKLPELITVLHQLHELGVRIAVDDFGACYASLNLLRQLPISILKIDRSLIQNLTLDKGCALLNQTIIHLAHELGIIVVGKGVESIEQLTLLQENHCDWIQGRYFSMPLVADEFKRFMQTQTLQ